MILEDRGVLAGWRRLWPTVRTQWKQYLAYAVAAWLLAFAGGIVVVLVAAVLAFALLIPLGVLLVVGLGLLSVAEPVGVAWLVATGVLSVVAGVLVLALAQTPVVTYLRYYGLLVLGDVETDFDVVAAQRAAVREPDES